MILSMPPMINVILPSSAAHAEPYASSDAMATVQIDPALIFRLRPNGPLDAHPSLKADLVDRALVRNAGNGCGSTPCAAAGGNAGTGACAVSQDSRGVGRGGTPRR